MAPSNSTSSPTFRKLLCVPSAKRNSIPAPRNNTILRLYSANSENGPDASTSATLTRQRKGSPLAGTRIASCVIPPPFFQGVAVNEALRMTCSLGFCTPVFYRDARRRNQQSDTPARPSPVRRRRSAARGVPGGTARGRPRRGFFLCDRPWRRHTLAARGHGNLAQVFLAARRRQAGDRDGELAAFPWLQPSRLGANSRPAGLARADRHRRRAAGAP